MTRTLVIVRHAKTEREHPDGDHERELAPRGVADATVLGRWLAEQELLPDLVLVSTAVRARQTAEHVLEGAGVPDAEEWPGGALYHRGVREALAAVREAPEDAATVWLVGHQPTMGTLALAVLRTEVAWGLLQSGLASLVAFHTARA